LKLKRLKNDPGGKEKNRVMTQINYQKEIKKLQDKIISLQDLIINKEKNFELASKESAKYCLELLDECTKKNNKISDLEHENFAIKAVVARE
jgi:hypothetical protein